MSFVKLLQEFGDRYVSEDSEDEDDEDDSVEQEKPDKKLSTIVAGWNEAAKMFVAQASLEELQEVKDSLLRLARGTGKCCRYPVHKAAKIGAVKLMEFILRTSFDMNTKNNLGMTPWHWACSIGKTETAQLLIQSSKEFGIDLNAKGNYGSTAWHWACSIGKTETAQLLIKSSKEFGIDLNAKSNSGWTAWHLACYNCQTETVQMILKNWKEFGIDIKAQDDDGKTALDIIRWKAGEWNQIKKICLINEEEDEEDDDEYDEIKKMLEEEYSQIDVTESVQS